MIKDKFAYGKMIHLILESGKIFRSKEELEKYIRKHYKPINEYLELNNREKLLNTVWKIVNTKRPVNYYRFISNLIDKGYKIFIEKPILTIKLSSKAKNYSYKKDIPDIVLYNSKEKKVIVIDIKSGSKRKKITYKKQVLRYEEVLKRLFNTDKIEAYLYYFKYDEFVKIDF